jgi:metal-responsive CopG/Arc/MetJ family transcriptional regulator
MLDMTSKSNKDINLRYATVKIPRAMTDKITKIGEHYGYRSVSEFVIDAARRRLEELD